jgi:hypothetical protein
LRQAGSYLGYTDRDGNVLAKAAHDPNPTFDACHGDLQTLADALTRIAEHPSHRLDELMPRSLARSVETEQAA